MLHNKERTIDLGNDDNLLKVTCFDNSYDTIWFVLEHASEFSEFRLELRLEQARALSDAILEVLPEKDK